MTSSYKLEITFTIRTSWYMTFFWNPVRYRGMRAETFGNGWSEITLIDHSSVVAIEFSRLVDGWLIPVRITDMTDGIKCAVTVIISITASLTHDTGYLSCSVRLWTLIEVNGHINKFKATLLTLLTLLTILLLMTAGIVYLRFLL